ncbi:MAG: hypothetical protein U0X92_04335 [Anaerolineales bacterium]
MDECARERIHELTKRLLDFIGGLIGMIVLAVLSPLISLVILVDSGLPISYQNAAWQRRQKVHDLTNFEPCGRMRNRKAKRNLPKERSARDARRRFFAQDAA